MVTQNEVTALVRAHADGDRERFKSITLQIAASAEQAGRHQVSRELRGLINGVQTLIPLGAAQNVLVQAAPKLKLDEVLLDPSCRAELDDLVREWKERDRLRARGLDARRRILLLGPPGTGKTATAGALADVLGLPFFIARLDTIVDSYLGNTGKHLRTVFDAVKSMQGVFLLDEFDAISARRDGRREDVGEMRRALNALLQYLEEDGIGIVVAATNLTALLDGAVFRRFELVLQYELPGKDDVERLVMKQLAQADVARADVDWKALHEAVSGLSHSEVESAARSAARKLVLGGGSASEVLISKVRLMQRPIMESANAIGQEKP